MYYRKVTRIARCQRSIGLTDGAQHCPRHSGITRVREEMPRTVPVARQVPAQTGPLITRTLVLRLMGQVIKVQDRVEHQGITPHRLSAIDRVVCKQKHIAFAQVCIHNDGMLGD